MNAGSATLATVLVLVSTAPMVAARASRSPAETNREAAAVQRTIEGSARAFTEFSRTRDIGSVLAFYAKDFTGVENGQDAGLEEQRALLEDLRKQLMAGGNVGMSLKTTNIEIRVTGPIAWATYDYLFRIGSSDGTWDEEEGKCTSILEKVGSVWLYKHEHCSSVCPDEEDDDESDDDSLQDRT